MLAELHRRDVRQERREAVEERRRIRWQANQRTRQFRRDEVERLWLEADAGTKGNMLNRRGKEAGADERYLFVGPESRARKYASEELLNCWRPTRGRLRRISRAASRGWVTTVMGRGAG